MTMTQVFLNYRAADEPFGVAMLDQELSRRFSPEAVFLASKSILPGTDWEKAMFDAVRASSAVLAVMGRNWLDARDDRGRRRLDDPTDTVRREILLALSLGKPVIPVRLGVPRFTRAELVGPLAELFERQDVEVRFRNHQVDVDHLAHKLRELIPGLPNPLAARRAEVSFSVDGHAGSVVQAERIDVQGGFHAGPAINFGRGDS
ncbi:MAG: toll/interleukin-1 receptor domain-containing protein [Saccharothrix sp.]|nr:toll/interleukin-1 receptor domain-containing protein [Saccharothrix sp.]